VVVRWTYSGAPHSDLAATRKTVAESGCTSGNVSVEEESERCESWSTSWVMLLIVRGVRARSIAACSTRICRGQCKAVQVSLTEAMYLRNILHFSAFQVDG